MHQPKKIPSPGAYLYLYTQPNLIDAGKTQARSSAVVHATASNKRLRSFQTCNNFGQLKKGNFVLSWAQYSAIRSNWLGDGLAHVKLVAFFVEFSFFFKLKKLAITLWNDWYLFHAVVDSWRFFAFAIRSMLHFCQTCLNVCLQIKLLLLFFLCIVHLTSQVWNCFTPPNVRTDVGNLLFHFQCY